MDVKYGLNLLPKSVSLPSPIRGMHMATDPRLHRWAGARWAAMVLAGVILGIQAAEPGRPATSEWMIPELAWQPRSDWASVRQAGALGDGSADDTAAIQTVLDRVKNGSTVYFPPGTYRITRTLKLRGPLIGVLLVGHGRRTILRWDGAEGGRIFSDNGVAYSRYVGFVFEGGKRAATGFYHWSDRRFETEVRHQHLAFRGFTGAAVLVARDDAYALAETSFENCLFEDCAKGVSTTSFNDYNYTFDGCEFRRCGIGINCVHGNFYVRNSRFEQSRVVDIRALQEHGCSVRRTVSVGSRRFLDFNNSVSPMTIENCTISEWQAMDGAIVLNGAPVLLFDNRFTNPPGSAPPLRAGRLGQRLLFSGNTPDRINRLVSAATGVLIYTIPPGRVKPAEIGVDTHFLSPVVRVPGKVFDARRDFGAAGDGRTDDTAAVQACIEAAREHGRAAIAYLPTGKYVIRQTVRLTGSNYVVGGSGFRTSLVWRGVAGGTLLAIHDPDHITLEHIAVGNHDSGAMNNGIDILQTGSGKVSHMTYDGVFVYGMYQKKPFDKGLHFRGLGSAAVVRMPHVQGNLRFIDSAAATILATMSFEGSVTVEGRSTDRGGLLGFLTRLSTLTTHGLYVRDNHSLVMSDFYVEQADSGFVFEGASGLPSGYVTIQGAKLHLTEPKGAPDKGTAIAINNYGGRIAIGHDQFYVKPTDVRITHRGDQPLELLLMASCFYRTRLKVSSSPAMHLMTVGNEAKGSVISDRDRDAALICAAAALDDLRRLGKTDLELNHPGVHGN